jgi:F-type H+-transporting ATPase subunit b
MQIIPQPIPTLVLVVPFLVTFVALWQILFKPLFEYLEDRDRVSREALAEAKHLRHDADARLADIEARIAAGRKEAADHRATARAAAQKQEAVAVRAARAAADARVAEAVGQIGQQRQAAAATLRGQANDLARDLARQVLGREL